MRVMIGKVAHGEQMVTIVPNRRAHLAPVLFKGPPGAGLWDAVREGIDQVKEREGVQRRLPGPPGS